MHKWLKLTQAAVVFSHVNLSSTSVSNSGKLLNAFQSGDFLPKKTSQEKSTECSRLQRTNLHKAALHRQAPGYHQGRAGSGGKQLRAN